jgi:hypothetical protein
MPHTQGAWLCGKSQPQNRYIAVIAQSAAARAGIEAHASKGFSREGLSL